MKRTWILRSIFGAVATANLFFAVDTAIAASDVRKTGLENLPARCEPVTGPVEYGAGNKHWFCKGQLHRNDGPAVERADGTKEWYRNGLIHREDGPALERPDGSKEWYRFGLLHREDGPALEFADGTKEWYRDGKKISPPVTSASPAPH